MKQGSASHSGSGATKPHTVSKAVPPAYPDQMGRMMGNHADHGTIRMQKIPMYEGRGLEAPKAKHTVHPHGSQSHHK